LGSAGIAALIVNLGTRWRWVVSFTPRPLYLRYPLDKRLGRRGGGLVSCTHISVECSWWTQLKKFIL